MPYADMLTFFAKCWGSIVMLLTRVFWKLASIFCLLLSICPVDIPHPSLHSRPTPTRTFIIYLYPTTSFNRPSQFTFRGSSPSTALPQPSDETCTFISAIKGVAYKVKYMADWSYTSPSHEVPIQIGLTTTKVRTGLGPALPAPADIIGLPSSALVRHDHIMQILVAGLFLSFAVALGCLSVLTHSEIYTNRHRDGKSQELNTDPAPELGRRARGPKEDQIQRLNNATQSNSILALHYYQYTLTPSLSAHLPAETYSTLVQPSYYYLYSQSGSAVSHASQLRHTQVWLERGPAQTCQAKTTIGLRITSNDELRRIQTHTIHPIERVMPIRPHQLASISLEKQPNRMEVVGATDSGETHERIQDEDTSPVTGEDANNLLKDRPKTPELMDEQWCTHKRKLLLTSEEIFYSKYTSYHRTAHLSPLPMTSKELTWWGGSNSKPKKD